MNVHEIVMKNANEVSITLWAEKIKISTNEKVSKKNTSFQMRKWTKMIKRKQLEHEQEYNKFYFLEYQ